MTLTNPGAIVSNGPGEKKYWCLIFEVNESSVKVYNEHRSNIIFEIPTHLAETFAEDMIIAIDALDDWWEESS